MCVSVSVLTQYQAKKKKDLFTWAGGGERKEMERVLSRPCTKRRAWGGTQSHYPEITTLAKTKIPKLSRQCQVLQHQAILKSQQDGFSILTLSGNKSDSQVKRSVLQDCTLTFNLLPFQMPFASQAVTCASHWLVKNQRFSRSSQVDLIFWNSSQNSC